MPELPLRDIHLPAEISWWPLAIGWWFVIVALMLIFGGTLILIWRKCRPTLRKEAMAALDRIEKQFHENEDAHLCLAQLSILLRRAAISQNYKRSAITGMAWLKVLDQQLGKPEFSQGPGQLLLTGPYRKEVDKEELHAFLQLCKRWVEKI